MLKLCSFLVLCSVGTALFPPKFKTAPWNEDISESTDVDANSEQITQWLEDNGGWGYGNVFRTGMGLKIVEVGCGSRRKTPVVRRAPYYSACDNNITEIWLPADGNGSLGGWPDANWQVPCTGDCHLLLHDKASRLLYESFSTQVTVENGIVKELSTKCIVVWDLDYEYPTSLRGDWCTSANAAGMPTAPLLITADEVANGEITHASGFLLPTERVRRGYFMHPATHYGGPTATSEYAPIYGHRWRLKADYNVSKHRAAAQIILNSLKKYGMFLRDETPYMPLAICGDYYDGYTGAKWNDLDFREVDTIGVTPNDFEVMNGWGQDPQHGDGSTQWTGSCTKGHTDNDIDLQRDDCGACAELKLHQFFGTLFALFVAVSVL